MVATAESGSTEKSGKWVPPYISFKTLQPTLLEKMEQNPTPRIDRSYLDTFSGGYQAQVMAALRSLDLIGPNGEVQQTLKDLVSNREARPRLIGELVRRYYPNQLALAEEKETQAKLEDSFRSYGVTGSTLRRAIAFFMQAAQFAEIPLSKNWKIPSMSGSVTRRPGRGKGGNGKGPTGQETHHSVEPPAPPPTMEGLKARYIDLLMKKVESADSELDEALLDRIEGLLGFERPRSYEDEMEME
jgi:hypothetical protein